MKKPDGRTQGNLNILLSKEEIEPYKDLPFKKGAKELNVSEYIFKKSLVHHGLFRGKTYHLICENCQKTFDHFINDFKFCSNDCKHKKQLIWNRGKTKKDDERILKSSTRMQGNTLGSFVNFHKANKEKIYLPNLNKEVEYCKNSSLEKEWLLQADKMPGIQDITIPDFSISYKDEFGKSREYYPDFILKFNSGLKWIVEVKGMCTDETYLKIEQATIWAKENGYDYRIITTGMIKKNTWTTVYSHLKNVKIPSIDWIMMQHAVTWAQLSPSPRLKVGAIITDKTKTNILSHGFNGDEKGGSNIPQSINPGEDGFIHAEENALLKLNSNESSILYCTDMPCIHCAKRIINSGNIEEVFYLRSYRDYSGLSLLNSRGIKTYKFEIVNFEGQPFDENTAYDLFIPPGLKDLA